MPDWPVIQYRVDAADRFIAVNPAWVAEAEAVGRRGRWVEVEEAMDRLDLFDVPALPQLTHGICPACEATLDAALEHPPSPEPSDIVLGDRLPPPTRA